MRWPSRWRAAASKLAASMPLQAARTDFLGPTQCRRCAPPAPPAHDADGSSSVVASSSAMPNTRRSTVAFIPLTDEPPRALSNRGARQRG
ncbi:proline-rich receptor-like protein kinase PERK12 [Iris pallida]|uniref:Proline-rich receptor-like protein kinase PERK12 n=1 Tax=Iris pallida TaxID=29817 RepID=A0AAX6G101_IRIPA|nr:proline-rich receptor-like protein kinase PERK12 [Iris pallida]